MESVRLAVIDMGSNSFRLVVIEYTPHLAFKEIDEVRESVRVGEGMATADALRPVAIERAVRTMHIYASFCRAMQIDEVLAVGTSAIRDARNRASLTERVKRETGIPVRVLSGEEEAYYGYLAAVNSTLLTDGLVMDIGGGSMQLTRVENRQRCESVSFPLGAVRLTEGYLKSDPVEKGEVKALVNHLHDILEPLTWLRAKPGMVFVGEGGTLRLIARLAQKRTNYPFDRLHGYELRASDAEDVRKDLAERSIAERVNLPGMKPDRADISFACAVAITEVMQIAGYNRMTVCGQGLREGIFYERFLTPDGGTPSMTAPPLVEDVRRASVSNLAHLYRYQEVHVEHVIKVTLSMFDQLRARMPYCGENERDLLWASSMLHDIGVIVDYHDHHKHGSYLILNAGLPGYTPRETALIALIVRYHRKGEPKFEELSSLMHDHDDDRLLQLTALLRLAEQIDRGRDGAVESVQVHLHEHGATLELITRGDEQVAVWALANHRDIFKAAFGLDLDVVAVPGDA